MSLIPPKGKYARTVVVKGEDISTGAMPHQVNLDYVPGIRDGLRKYNELKNSLAGWFDFTRQVREVPENGYSAELTNELTDNSDLIEKIVYRKALDAAVKDVEKEGYKVHFKSKEEMKREFNDEKGYEIGRDIYVCFELPELEKLYVLGHERTGKNYRDHMANHEKIRAAEKPFADKYVSKAMEYFLDTNKAANVN